MEIYRILFSLILLSLFSLILTNQIQQLQQQRLFTGLHETNLRIARLGILVSFFLQYFLVLSV